MCPRNFAQNTDQMCCSRYRLRIFLPQSLTAFNFVRSRLPLVFTFGSRYAPAGFSPIKSKSQKIEDLGPRLAVSRSPEIDQPGLFLIKRKFIPNQSTAEPFAHSQGILFSFAADHQIVCVPEPGYLARTVGFDDFFQPDINHVMRKDVGEYRAAQTALYDPLITNPQFSFYQNTGFEHPLDVAQEQSIPILK